MAIPLSDLTVRAMNKKLGPLVSRDLTTDVDSLLLRAHNSTYTLTSFTAYRPPVFVRNYMMILLFAHTLP